MSAAMVDLTKPDTSGDSGAEVVYADQPIVRDPQYAPEFITSRLDGKRRPIIPQWMHNRAELNSTARRALGYVGYTLAYHSVRLAGPYQVRVLVRAPIGAARILGRIYRWIGDQEARPLRSGAIRDNEPTIYLRLNNERNLRVRWRASVATVAALLVGGALTALVAVAPTALLMALGVPLVVLLAHLGSPKDAPLVSRAVVRTEYLPLRFDHVEEALGRLGIAEMNRALHQIQPAGPVMRDGPGWRAEVDLPPGVVVTDVMERRDRLASALRRPLAAVWPETDSNAHAGRMILWVGDHALNKRKREPWPLLREGRADVFRPLPFGVDQRSRPVAITLFEANVLIGAIPGAGKTGAVLAILLAAALDPTCEIWCYEFKGTDDLEQIAKVAHRHGSGSDDDTLREGLVALRLLMQECTRRAATIKRLKKAGRMTGAKTNRQLADDRTLDLHPLVAAFDECQDLFSHEEYGAEARKLALWIIRKGRALGVILILATQRPDKDSLPTGVSSLMAIRFCLKVMDQTSNDMILGTSKYKQGIRATTFTLDDRGIGYLSGATPEDTIARTYYLTAAEIASVTNRARQIRQQLGLLTGMAAGETFDDEEPPKFSALEDVAHVMGDAEQMHNDEILPRLAELRPDVYRGWTPAVLTKTLRGFGVTVKGVWRRRDDGGSGNRVGVKAADLREVLAGSGQDDSSSGTPREPADV